MLQTPKVRGVGPSPLPYRSVLEVSSWRAGVRCTERTSSRRHRTQALNKIAAGNEMESPKWHAGGTCNRPLGHRPQRRAQRAGHGPGTRYWPRPRQPGSGRPPACDALTGMETAGTVTRAGGGKPGIPDTWTLAPPGQVTGQPEPGPDGEHAAQPGIPAASGQDEPRRATRVDGSSGAGDRGWCHGRGRSVRQVSVALSIATAGAPAPVIA